MLLSEGVIGRGLFSLYWLEALDACGSSDGVIILPHASRFLPQNCHSPEQIVTVPAGSSSTYVLICLGSMLIAWVFFLTAKSLIGMTFHYKPISIMLRWQKMDNLLYEIDCLRLQCVVGSSACLWQSERSTPTQHLW